jgi:hypothetical protein
VEGSQTAGADSARGFATVSATPQSPKAPSTPGHSRASTPMPSAAASLASGSASVNSFALSLEDDEEEEQGGGDGDDADGLQVLGLKRSDMDTEVGQARPRALPAARRNLDLAQLPKGWRQPQQQQQPAAAVVAGGSNSSSNGSKYSSAAGSNGNGKSASSSNGAGAVEVQQQQQLVGAANDIVPLGNKVASDRVTAGGSSKGQQAAQHQ